MSSSLARNILPYLPDAAKKLTTGLDHSIWVVDRVDTGNNGMTIYASVAISSSHINPETPDSADGYQIMITNLLYSLTSLKCPYVPDVRYVSSVKKLEKTIAELKDILLDIPISHPIFEYPLFEVVPNYSINNSRIASNALRIREIVNLWKSANSK